MWIKIFLSVEAESLGDQIYIFSPLSNIIFMFSESFLSFSSIRPWFTWLSCVIGD